jgi:hypothetical protein
VSTCRASRRRSPALYEYADAVIADRRRNPRDDFVTCLVQAQDGEAGLTAAELRDSLVLLIFGGFDTTRNQLGLAMQVFLDHPGQWRLLAQRPELAPAAVEEVMRFRPTTTWVTREAVADFTFDGLAIEAGTTIHLFGESAGTDPRAVSAAGFDITAGGGRPISASAAESITASATTWRGRTCARPSPCSPACSASRARPAQRPGSPTAGTPAPLRCPSRSCAESEQC